MTNYKIVLLKAESEEEDEYLKLLESNRLDAYCLSPIKFEFQNLDDLKEKLKNNFLDNYSSLVITSPRIIQILKLFIENDQLNLELLKSIPLITVGPQTYRKSQDELKIEPLINNINQNINNGKELANYLNENQTQLSKQINLKKPFLYPTSDLSKEEFKVYLNSSIKVEKLICYQTLPNPNLDQELNSLLIKVLGQNGIVDELVEREFIFVFFSPSGLINFKQTVNCIKLEKLKLISIGPTTKKTIEDNKLNLIGTCSKPTPNSLLETILNYIKIN